MACLLATMLGCAGGEGRPGPRRTVIIIFIDTLRADHLGCYGYPKPTSPHLDALAAEGVLFENIIAQSSWTLPSFISAFTSTYTVEREGRDREERIPEKLPVITEYFQDAGFATGGFVDMVYLHSKYGFNRGFETYLEEDRVGTESLVAAALAWLDEEPERSHFLFLHTYDVHGPYDPPEPFDELFVTPEALAEPAVGRAPQVSGSSHIFNAIPGYQFRKAHSKNLEYYVAQYDGSIAHVDDALGVFFEALKERNLYEEALIVVSSDHGESLTEARYFLDHGILTDPVIKVPLIIRFPGSEHGGTRLAGQGQLIDLYPTLLELLGEEPRAPIGGHSLMPVVRGERRETAPRAYSAGGIMDQWTLRTPRWKFVRKIPGSGEERTWRSCPDSVLHDRDAVIEQLFDLRADPGELHDRTRTDRAVAADLSRLLDAWKDETLLRRAAFGEGGRVTLTEEELEKLRTLGYVSE